MKNFANIITEPKIKKGLSQEQYIAVGFFLMVLMGTFLLMLPISSRDGSWTDPLSACFTACSSSCVTGLVVFDTYRHWSMFGQLIILTLIQIGGLGFVTIGIMFSIMLRRKIGLKDRSIMQDSISALELRGIVRLYKLIIKGTFIVEGTGAVCLSFIFVPKLGIIRGIYYSIFHSISAFCNAGFDLMGRYEEYSSFVSLRDNLWANVVLCLLILIGGLGFMVWQDLYENKFNFKKYKLHTKLVLIGTLIFTIGGAVLFWLFEKNNLLNNVSPVGQFSASLFGSVTPRTAGFNTTDTGALSDASQILTLFLMLVGGNSGSTAGGVKVTTIVILYLFVFSSLRKTSAVEVYGRRVTDDTVRKASVVFMLNMTLAVVAAMIICAIQQFSLKDVLFETFSAVNTVGMTRNLTRELNSVSKMIIIILMYFGRVGSMNFALSFMVKKNADVVRCPVEEISVG